MSNKMQILKFNLKNNNYILQLIKVSCTRLKIDLFIYVKLKKLILKYNLSFETNIFKQSQLLITCQKLFAKVVKKY